MQRDLIAAFLVQQPTPSTKVLTKRARAHFIPLTSRFTFLLEYTVKLNQTNVGGNNNKFYIINLLTKESHYWVWTRWGRVGEEGQNMLIPFG